eukprot:8525131-Lingulodinium_polyedra.AAC.1
MSTLAAMQNVRRLRRPRVRLLRRQHRWRVVSPDTRQALGKSGKARGSTPRNPLASPMSKSS